MRRLLIGVATILALNACGGSSPAAPTPTPTPAELSIAPTRVVVAGKPLALEAFLTRDFMPISPPDGKPLVAVLRVTSEDGSPVSATVRADMAWVVKGEEAWSAIPREERSRTDTSPNYELVARDGPKWGPGIAVDVVVRLLDGGGRSYLLRAPNRTIAATF